MREREKEIFKKSRNDIALEGAGGVCVYVCACVLGRFSHVWLSATLWTIACQASLSMGFSGQEYSSGLPCPSPRHLPKPGVKLLCLSFVHWFSSVQFSCSVMSNSLRPHGLQHARTPCLKLMSIESVMTSNQLIFCHPLLLQPSIFPSIRVFFQCQFFASGGQSIGASASASVLPMNIQDWFPLELTGLVSSQSKGLSRVFFNTSVESHQFFGTQFSL